MRTSWHDIWGSARGPVMGLAPQTRLLSGATIFAACMVAPAATLQGPLIVIGATVMWLIACRPPLKVVRGALVLGLVLFLPYFLLLPIIPVDPSPGIGRWWHAVAVPWGVLLRGLSGMLVSIGTVASLSASDLREGLLRLPVPRVVSAILLQIVHQAATLFYETRRVASAVAVRGASNARVTGWRVLSSLPRVWLPRIIVRAERVAAAMELRGYCDGDLRSFRQHRMGLADGAALVLAIGVLGLSVMARIRGIA